MLSFTLSLSLSRYSGWYTHSHSHTSERTLAMEFVLKRVYQPLHHWAGTTVSEWIQCDATTSNLTATFEARCKTKKTTTTAMSSYENACVFGERRLNAIATKSTEKYDKKLTYKTNRIKIIVKIHTQNFVQLCAFVMQLMVGFCFCSHCRICVTYLAVDKCNLVNIYVCVWSETKRKTHPFL